MQARNKRRVVGRTNLKDQTENQAGKREGDGGGGSGMPRESSPKCGRWEGARGNGGIALSVDTHARCAIMLKR